jgi:hypothetical protein
MEKAGSRNLLSVRKGRSNPIFKFDIPYPNSWATDETQIKHGLASVFNLCFIRGYMPIRLRTSRDNLSDYSS